MRNKIPELLAPAGSIESLRAAVNAGADAIYVGGAKYGARAYAENPEEADLIGGLRYAHRFGVRIHMTVNTLFKEAELQTLKPVGSAETARCTPRPRCVTARQDSRGASGRNPDGHPG